MEIYKQVETKPNFFTPSELEEGYKSRFVRTTYIYKSLIDEHYTTSLDDLTKCTTCLTVLDPTIMNSTFDIPTPTTDMYLKFPFQMVNFTPLMKLLALLKIILLEVISLMSLPLQKLNLCVHQHVIPLFPHPVMIIYHLLIKLFQKFTR